MAKSTKETVPELIKEIEDLRKENARLENTLQDIYAKELSGRVEEQKTINNVIEDSLFEIKAANNAIVEAMQNLARLLHANDQHLTLVMTAMQS